MTDIAQRGYDIEHRGYAHPEVLVSTDWVANNISNPTVRILESNEDSLLYSSGHIPNALEIDWVTDLNDPVRRDYLHREKFQELVSRLSISPETTVVFYGDKNNWWAAYALWVFKLFGHDDCRIMDGGSAKWRAEQRPMTREVPNYPATDYSVSPRSDSAIRAFRDDVLKHLDLGGSLVDVRSVDEFTGKRLHMPEYPNEGALRGGHIPGAFSIPWAQAVQSDGTFKPATELKSIYQPVIEKAQGEEIIAYCRIGERSSHTWFVLKYLLGYDKVRNYDGSWTEWGNLVNVPIEK